jgi:hypothetical protein
MGRGGQNPCGSVAGQRVGLTCEFFGNQESKKINQIIKLPRKTAIPVVFDYGLKSK